MAFSGEVQLKAKEENTWQKESPILDLERMNKDTVAQAKTVLGGFVNQKPVKDFLKTKKDSKFFSIIKDLSPKTVTEVVVASGAKTEAYSVAVKTIDGPRTLTLAVDDVERLSLSMRKGGKDVVQEMLVYKKGEIDYQKA